MFIISTLNFTQNKSLITNSFWPEEIYSTFHQKLIKVLNINCGKHWRLTYLISDHLSFVTFYKKNIEFYDEVAPYHLRILFTIQHRQNKNFQLENLGIFPVCCDLCSIFWGLRLRTTHCKGHCMINITGS